ncbi:MAG: hypothetical protein SFW08_02975, partial [Gemmatimonadaceae bacterium]|nr:hypothetical protein [Gemmatimonadaceae bacterium]
MIDPARTPAPPPDRAVRHSLPRRRPSSVLAVLLGALTLVLAACRDDVSGPGGIRRAFLNVLPVFQPTASLQGTGRNVDTVRVRLQRPGASQPAVDTFFVFPPNADSLVMVLDVPITGGEEEFEAALEMRSQGEVLFSGVQRVRALSASAPGAGQPAQVPIVFVGPGARARTLTLSPRDTVITFGDSIAYRAVALDSAQAPVANAVIAWSADSTFAIGTNGVFRAPNRRGVIRVRARVPAGPADSTTLRIVPRAAALRSQIGLVADTINATVPVAVRVLAADSLGVAGVPVRFATPVGGGTVRDSVVISDSAGVAATTVSYGPVVGLNRVTATVAGVGTVQADVQSRAGVATAVELFGGNAQTATVGDTLPLRLAVRTRDRRGNISPGAAVRVRATSAGTVLDTIITSDSLGVARARARLRVGAGLNTFAARLVADSTQSVSFDATGLPAPASVIVVTGGTSQIVIAGAVAPQPIRAEVRDAFGNVRVGDTVVFTHPGTAKWADSSIVARVVQSATGALSPVFRVSTTAGTDSVVVSAGVLSSRVAVSIIAGPAARLVALSGTGQSAVAGDTLASPLAVLVQDQFANLTSGRVTFAARRLGGTLTPASVDALDGVGLAVSRYRVPTTVGADTVWARLGVRDSVAFPLTVVPGAPTALSIVGGDGQVDTVRAILPTLLAVRATDGNGNAVPNASVRFRVTVGPSATLSNETVAADAGGIARTQLQLPTATGAVQVRAELVADTSRHVVLVAAATPGRAVGATLQSGPSAPYIAGDSLATPFVFSLRDRFGNAVGAGASGRFRWAVGATGRVNGDTASTTLTDAAGQLRAFVRLPSVAGAASLVLQVDTAAVSVALTTVAGAPASLVLLGNATTGTAGGVSSAPIQVRVSDAFGNPIIADTVTFSALRGGPFVDSTAVVRILTNAAGEATSPLVRLSAAAGVDSGIVSIRGLTAIWRTTVTPGTADATQSGWTYAGPAPWAPWAVRLTSLPATPAFVARDVNGNALPGVSVRISTLGPLGNGIGRGTLGGTDTAITVVTDANGEARPPTWVLGELGRSGLRAQAGSVVIDFSATAAPEGTTRAWVGPATAGGNAELTEPSNWLPAGVPSAGDYAFVGPVYQARPRVSSSVSFSPDTMFLYESPIVQAGVTLSLRGQANLLGASFDTTQGTVAFARPGQVIAFVGGLTDTVRLPSVRVDSGAMVVGNAAIAGSLLVRSPLVLTSTTLRVSGPFEVSGAVARLQMLTPNATIRALGGALFDGDSSTNQMDAGLLEVRGRFRQIGTHSAASFRPTGTFRTRFVGSDDSVSFANPAPDARGSGFNVLEMGPQAALTISGSVFANNLGPHGGSSILVPAGASLQFPPFRRLVFESATNVTVNGSLAAACYLEDDGASVNGTGSIPPRCVQALQFVTTPPTLGFVNAPLPSIGVGLVELGGPRAEAGITIRARYLNALNDTVAVLGTDTATTDALGHATFTNLIIPEVLSGARLVFTVANDPLGPTLVTPTTFDVQPPSLLADGPADKITFGPSNGITRQADDLPRLRLEAFGSPVVGAPVTLVPSPAAPSGAQVWPPVATTDGSGVVVLDSIAIGSAAVGTSWYIHYIVGGALVDSAVVRVTPPGVTALWVGGDGATAGERADWQRVGNWKPNAVPDATSHAFRRGEWSPVRPRIDANALVFPVRTLQIDELLLIRGGIRVVERLDAVVLDSAFLYPGANIFVRLDAGAVGRGVVPELRVGAGAAVTLDGQLQVAGPAT